jgi:hypothetical protein
MKLSSFPCFFFVRYITTPRGGGSIKFEYIWEDQPPFAKSLTP